MAKKYLLEGGEGSDLVTTLRTVVTMLNAEPDIQKGGLYHTLPGAMQDRVVKAGIMNIPEFVLLMQEIGLLRHRGGGRVIIWQVVCVTFFDEIISPPWLERAQACLAKRVESLTEARMLRERISELQAQTHGPVQSAGCLKSIDEIAEMVVAIETLKETVASRDVQIASLQADLAKCASVDHDAALAAAIKRARSRAT